MNDWEVPNSDEDEDPTYMPSPDTTLSLYTKIEKGEIFSLDVTIVPRKDPKVDKISSVNQELNKSQKKEGSEDSEKNNIEPNEFDFDSQTVDTVKRFTPRRTPNRSQTKKVARMDKVCSNIIKYEKLDAAQKDSVKSSSKT